MSAAIGPAAPFNATVFNDVPSIPRSEAERLKELIAKKEQELKNLRETRDSAKSIYKNFSASLELATREMDQLWNPVGLTVHQLPPELVRTAQAKIEGLRPQMLTAYHSYIEAENKWSKYLFEIDSLQDWLKEIQF